MKNVSIGNIGEAYFDAISDRTKAFLTVVCSSIEQIEQLIREALGAQVLGGRVAIRVIADGISEAQLRQSSFNCLGCVFVCEAVLPVNVSGKFIVYYGWNLPGHRSTPIDQVSAQADLLAKVMAKQKTTHVIAENTVVEMCNGESIFSDVDIDQLLHIYVSTFSAYLVEFTHEGIREMLGNNETALVRVNGAIVAVAMAEVAYVECGDEELVIAEISEVATHPDYQRRGLSYLATNSLCEVLKKRQIEVVFSEVRAASFGMMAVAWGCGLVPCGLLQKHCVISSLYSEVAQADEYGDLVVFGLPPQI